MSEKGKPSFGKKLLIPIILLLVILGCVVLGYSYLKKDLYTVMKVPDFTLVDQNNKTVSNQSLKGKVYLVEFFFSRCPTICPIMNSNMRVIQKEVDDPNFAIVSITIDPAYDTSEVLNKHAEFIGAKSPNWFFLTGDRSYIGSLADKFNIYVGKEDEKNKGENLNHSGLVALVDQHGKVRCRYNKEGVPILYYSMLNYSDPEGTQPDLRGKYHPDCDDLIQDIKTLLKK